jgi:hypothetical protein
MSEVGIWTPESEAERQAIREQLERIFADPLFSHSRRYPSFLRYVVEQTLAGKPDQLKERNIGIDVFSREPDYDTSMEPVVRTTAVEIRKRLSQYYQNPARHSEIRIDLPTGSYVPEFRHPPEVELPSAAPEPDVRRRNWSLLWFLLGLIGIGIAVIAVYRSHPFAAPSAFDRFWRPLLSAPGPVLFCIGGPRPDQLGVTPQDTKAPAREPSAYQTLRMEFVALADSVTFCRIAGLLNVKSKAYHIRRYDATSFADLRNVPLILIGAFNNPWSMQFSRALRFTFELQRIQGPEGEQVVVTIDDKQKPSNAEWQVNTSQQYSKVTDDYALICRIYDPNTQGTIVIVGGLLKWGTMAAGEFLSEPKYMEEIARL